MDEQEHYRRLRWQSRRGMLELDLVLEPFVENGYRELDGADKQRFERLLEAEDQELFGWFLGRIVPEDPELAAIVVKVLEFKRRRPDASSAPE